MNFNAQHVYGLLRSRRKRSLNRGFSRFCVSDGSQRRWFRSLTSFAGFRVCRRSCLHQTRIDGRLAEVLEKPGLAGRNSFVPSCRPTLCGGAQVVDLSSS